MSDPQDERDVDLPRALSIGRQAVSPALDIILSELVVHPLLQGGVDAGEVLVCLGGAEQPKDLEVLLEVRRLGGAAGQRGDSWDLGQQPELGGAA